MKQRIATCLALIAFIATAHAYSTTWDTVNNSVTYTETGVVDSNMGGGSAVSVFLPQFNTDAPNTPEGTTGIDYELTQIVIEINGSLEFTVEVESETPTAEDFDVGIGGVGAIMQAGIYSATEGYNDSDVLSLAADDEYTYPDGPNLPADWTGDDYGIWSGISAGMNNGSMSYSDATALAYFTGTGNIEWTVNYNLILGASGPNHASDTVGTGTAAISVTYFYDVPEPGTMALAGLGGLVAMLRRRFGKRTTNG